MDADFFKKMQPRFLTPEEVEQREEVPPSPEVANKAHKPDTDDPYPAVPAELKAYRQWVVWLYHFKTEDDKPSKMLYQTNGWASSVSDPGTWTTYPLALICYQEHSTGKKFEYRYRPNRKAPYQHLNCDLAGIGYVFSPEDPFTGIDLDNCIDANGNIKPWARPIIDKLTQVAYNEVSPNNHGIKSWTQARLPEIAKHKVYINQTADEAIEAGNVVQTKPGNVPRYKRYLDEQKGKALNNIWVDIPNLTGRNNERVGYPTQKPLALLERIILASSNRGDIVLDPFCGCATTCIAAEKHPRQWIGIDLSPKAVELVKLRLDRDLELTGDANLLGQQVIHRTDIPTRLHPEPTPDIQQTSLFGVQSDIETVLSQVELRASNPTNTRSTAYRRANATAVKCYCRFGISPSTTSPHVPKAAPTTPITSSCSAGRATPPKGIARKPNSSKPCVPPVFFDRHRI